MARLGRNAVCVATLCLAGVWLGGCSPAGMALTVASTAGVAAVQERGFVGALDDTAIKARISEAYLQASEAILLAVTIRVTEGRVMLVGALADPELRRRAVDLARAQPGVREVIDELQAAEGDLSTYAQDAWITAQVNAKLTFDIDVFAVNYTVDTVGKVVYLAGIAEDQRELDRVVRHAQSLSAVRRVVSHVVLKDDPRRPGG